MNRPALIVLPLLAVASCAPVGEAEEFVSDAPPVRVVGQAERCIDPSRIRSQRVHDDRTIDFRLGRTIYRNTLDRPCPRLGFEEAITYDVRGGRLCTPDIVYVLDTTGTGIRRGAPCSLGEFVPVEYLDDVSDADMVMDEG